MDPTQTEELQEAAIDVAGLVVGGALGLVVGLLAALVVAVVVRMVLRRRPPMRHLVRRGRRPLAGALGVLGMRAGMMIALPAGTEPAWFEVLHHGLTILFIVCLAWLAVALISGSETAAMESVAGDSLAQGSRARRLQTQAQLLSRVASAVVLTIAVAAVLLTFPGARAFGTSILASAGIASVVVGLAAQSVLANLFAGLQIAFSDSLRLDDTVLVEGHQGNVEEITLTYIVVKVWDERRLVLPSSYFTTTPFENLTRTSPAMSGTVEIDVDWSVPLPAARAQVRRIAAASSSWDGRSADLDVTDATGGAVRLRAFVTARDNSALWTLRCEMREGLVEWIQRSAPYAVEKSHHMLHDAPGGWVDLAEDATADLEAELSELETAGRPADTLDGDLRAVDVGDVLRPGDTQRLSARTARRRAHKEDRRRARELPGALGRAEDVPFQPLPSTEMTRIMPGLPPAEELPGVPEGLGPVTASAYGAVPSEMVDPARRSVRSRLAALGRRAREDDAADPLAPPGHAAGSHTADLTVDITPSDPKERR